MLVHTKKRPIKQKQETLRIQHAGVIYIFPRKVAEKYRLIDKNSPVDTDIVFEKINKKYSKPGALLRGIRVRENLTQLEMAHKIKVTQSDISQIENGTRRIGRKIAKRIEKLFAVDYRSFLE